jgi:CMP-N-acetylneuraminic acid synthetase
MRVVGIIPARGGSQRLPRKNLALLADRPLVAWTCESAHASGLLSAVYINTDSPEIAAIAGECDVACPQLRPATLAGDSARTHDAVTWLMRLLAARGETYDAVMILQPTSPLRNAEDIRGALALFEENAPCAVVSVTPVAPADWLGRIHADGRFEREVGESTLFRLNGAIYVYHWEDYLTGRTPRKTLAYTMPPERSVDIDTPTDLRIAEALLSAVCLARP